MSDTVMDEDKPTYELIVERVHVPHSIEDFRYYSIETPEHYKLVVTGMREIKDDH